MERGRADCIVFARFHALSTNGHNTGHREEGVLLIAYRVTHSCLTRRLYNRPFPMTRPRALAKLNG